MISAKRRQLMVLPWFVMAMCVVTSARGQLLDPLDFSSLGTLNLASGSFTIDTDALTITGPSVNFTGVVDDQNGAAVPSAVPEIVVFTFDDINLSSSASISITGTRALALLSHGSAVIDTELTVDGGDGTDSSFSSVPGVGGPGGFAGGDQGGDPGLLGEDGSGPGGGGAGSGGVNTPGSGGFGSAGQTGGKGAGGVIYGDLAALLQGGSGGGGSSFAAAGGGGGAIEIGVLGGLEIGPSGSVRANGGRGGLAVLSEAGGSGSGGGIRLHGSSLTINGLVEARGGSSVPGYSGYGGGGRVLTVGRDILPFTVGTSTVDPNTITSGIDVRGGLDGGGNSVTNHGVITALPQLTIVPSGVSAVFGQTTFGQAASTTQPAISHVLFFDFLIQPDGEMQVPGGGYTNRHEIDLRGGNARITGTDPLVNEKLIEGGGSIHTTVINAVAANIIVSVGETLTITGSGNTNNGDISVVGGTLEFTQDLSNSAGAQINAINADLIFTGGLTNNGELNLINSSITGSVTAAAASSSLLGTNSVNGNYEMSPGDVLSIELGGVLPGEYDTLAVDGNATLSGVLNVSLDPGFEPSLDDSFEIVVATGALSGKFDSVNLPEFDSGMFWDEDYQNDVYALSVTDHVLGDLDGDGDVDDADVPLFILALTNRAAYDAEGFLTNTDAAGDVNLDGSFDFGDIGAFSTLLSEATSAQAVPEPSTLLLTLIAVALLLDSRRRIAFHH